MLPKGVDYDYIFAGTGIDTYVTLLLLLLLTNEARRRRRGMLPKGVDYGYISAGTGIDTYVTLLLLLLLTNEARRGGRGSISGVAFPLAWVTQICHGSPFRVPLTLPTGKPQLQYQHQTEVDRDRDWHIERGQHECDRQLVTAC